MGAASELHKRSDILYCGSAWHIINIEKARTNIKLSDWVVTLYLTQYSSMHLEGKNAWFQTDKDRQSSSPIMYI